MKHDALCEMTADLGCHCASRIYKNHPFVINDVAMEQDSEESAEELRYRLIAAATTFVD